MKEERKEKKEQRTHVSNHQIDPETGFLQSTAYPYAFDGQKKTLFLELCRENGMSIYKTCEMMSMDRQTFNKAYHADSVFKQAFDELERKYIDELEAVSRTNALNPKSVVERIFQLNALRPEKYRPQNYRAETNVTINVDADLLKAVVERDRVLDAVQIPQNNDSDTDLSQSGHAA